VARVFVSTTISINSWIGATNWGKDLSGAAVDTMAKFNAAVAMLRSANGRDPAYSWANPTKWAKFETDLASNTDITGNYDETIKGIKAMGIEPLMVVAVRSAGPLPPAGRCVGTCWKRVGVLRSQKAAGGCLLQ
jgi:hypothetical protein